ncbi:hypothetical protein [Paenibacillus glacialis]|uniref:Uncharacterized protein n=1 Tax=Paenibacillus glacialis TaxID=494026 RepID=A0A168HRN1_9BACL|nr:hypothetical protein [Paenibacillus glacialis]OAB38459.1 hypothetical protein PGLA_20420 [Paenibacillus glacialis]
MSKGIVVPSSSILLTDEQGSLTDRFTYGPYGELEKHEGKTNQPLAITEGTVCNLIQTDSII